MKRKTFLLLVILGTIWQMGFGQEQDSVGLQTIILLQDSVPIQDSLYFVQDSIVFDQDSLYKELLSLKLDSLITLKDSILFSLSNIENQIDSLGQILGKSSEIDTQEEIIENLQEDELSFIIKEVTTYMNTITIKVVLKGFKNENVFLSARVEVYEQEVINKNHKGTIPIFFRGTIEEDEQEIVLKTSVEKNRWKIRNVALKMNVHLRMDGKIYEITNAIEWERMRKKYMLL